MGLRPIKFSAMLCYKIPSFLPGYFLFWISHAFYMLLKFRRTESLDRVARTGGHAMLFWQSLHGLATEFIEYLYFYRW